VVRDLVGLFRNGRQRGPAAEPLACDRAVQQGSPDLQACDRETPVEFNAPAGTIWQ
jgi:hypothetical protein